MVKTIFKRKIVDWLSLFLFASIPFGQIIKYKGVTILDLSIILIFIYTVFNAKKYPIWYKYFLWFVYAGFFSWIVGYFTIPDTLTLKGFLYLIRLFIYSFIPVFFINFVKNKNKTLHNLLVSVLISALFGWVQYMFKPDMRNLKILGWDDHLGRMVGTYLDPGYLAILLLLGSILGFMLKKYLASGFLIFTLLFTYSRGSFLALLFLLFYFLLKTKKTKIFLLFISIFIFLILILPKGKGEGVNLLRTSTVYARLINYKIGIDIIKKSPVLGFGYNNICPVKGMYFEEKNIESHSCFGLDSSLLFIIATFGTTGFFILINILRRISFDKYSSMFIIVLLIHSLFYNSLFYPHVMTFVGILMGLGYIIKRN